ncbi:MAG: hypothetical protein MUE88_06455 [Flavobacteriales bacterium]|nr:hypothetical protein [Flavobacteriales bacterium]
MHIHRYEFLLLPLLVAGSSTAQTIGNYVYSPGFGPQHALERPGGTTLLMFENFNWPDSSTIELVWTDEFQNITQAAAFRIPGGSSRVHDMISVNDGCLLAAGYATPPHITRVNANGVVVWSKRLMNEEPLFNAQYALHTATREGDGSTLYAFADDFSTNTIIRSDLDGNGSAISGVRSTAGLGFTHRISGVVDTDDPAKDLLFGGSAFDPTDQGEAKVMVAEFTTEGCTWMKHYNMEPFVGALQFEEMWAMRRLTDGNYVCGGYATDVPLGTWHGFVMKLNSEGDVLWARTIEDPVHLRFGVRDIYEMPDGGLLVAGDNSDSADVSNTIVSGLSPTGELLWSSRYTGLDPLNALFFTSLADESSGMRLLGQGRSVMLDPTGNGCDFVPFPTLEGSFFEPPVTSIVRINSPFKPQFVGQQVESRVPQMSITLDCLYSANSVDELNTTAPAHPYPVPTDDMVWLPDVKQGDRIIVRDALGALVLQTRYDVGISLKDRPAGAYFVENLSTGTKRVVLRR